MNRRIQSVVWESHCIRTAISKILFAHAEALLVDMKVFEYLLRSKKYTDNLKRLLWTKLILLLNGVWDIWFSQYSSFIKNESCGYLQDSCIHTGNTYSVLRPV